MEVLPVVVPAGEAARGWVRNFDVALLPCFDDVVEKLFRPEQPRVALTADEGLVFGNIFRDDVVVELVGLADAFIEGLRETGKPGDAAVILGGVEAAADGYGFAGGNDENE